MAVGTIKLIHVRIFMEDHLLTPCGVLTAYTVIDSTQAVASTSSHSNPVSNTGDTVHISDSNYDV